MSTALVKEALELFDDVPRGHGSKKSQADSNQHLKVKNKYKKKKVRKRVNPETKLRLSSNAHDERWRFKKVDKTAVNLDFIKNQQSFRALDSKTVDKILDHHKQKNQRPPLEKSKKKAKQSSAFTDKDFIKFHREYIF